MTVLERIRRRRRAMAWAMLPLLAVVMLNGAVACVGMLPGDAAAGLALEGHGPINHGPHDHGLHDHALDGHAHHGAVDAHGSDASHAHSHSSVHDTVIPLAETGVP